MGESRNPVTPFGQQLAVGVATRFPDRTASLRLRTTSSAQGEVQVADGALQSVGTLLQRAQELAVQLGNDTYSATERAAGAQEINGISSQIVQLMNTQVAGRYIFGGNNDSTTMPTSTTASIKVRITSLTDSRT